MSSFQNKMFDKDHDNSPTAEDYFLIDETKKLDIEMGVEFEKRLTELRKYAVLLENPRDLEDESNRYNLLAKLSYALRRSHEGLAWATVKLKEAKINALCIEHEVESDQFLRWSEEQKKHDKKFSVTEKTKARFLHTIQTVKFAYRIVGIIDAMVQVLEGMRYEFVQGLSTIKTITYGNRVSNFMSSSASCETLKNIEE